MEGIIIRVAQEEDAAGIAEVHVRSRERTYRSLLPAAYLDNDSLADRSQRWRACLVSPAPWSVTWVAEMSGAILGFCRVGPSPDDDANESTGHVYAIYVDPPIAGQGIGAGLLAAGTGSLAKGGVCEGTLWVLAGNTRAEGSTSAKGGGVMARSRQRRSPALSCTRCGSDATFLESAHDGCAAMTPFPGGPGRALCRNRVGIQRQP